MTDCVFRPTALSAAEITSEVASFYATWMSFLLTRAVASPTI
jgi:hypothetical protein